MSSRSLPTSHLRNTTRFATGCNLSAFLQQLPVSSCVVINLFDPTWIQTGIQGDSGTLDIDHRHELLQPPIVCGCVGKWNGEVFRNLCRTYLKHGFALLWNSWSSICCSFYWFCGCFLVAATISWGNTGRLLRTVARRIVSVPRQGVDLGWRSYRAMDEWGWEIVSARNCRCRPAGRNDSLGGNPVCRQWTRETSGDLIIWIVSPGITSLGERYFMAK